MKVFISHSMMDHSLLTSLQTTLVPRGIDLLIAEHKTEFSGSITDKIKGMINQSHLGLFLLTNNGIQSGFVREEMGYYEAIRKPSLLVFEKGVEKKYGGFKFGHDSVQLDPENPQIAIRKVKSALLHEWNKMYERKIELTKLEADRKVTEQQNTLIGIGLLVGIVVLLGNSQ